MKSILPMAFLLILSPCHPSLSAQPLFSPVAARVTMHHGRPTIFFDGEPIAPMIYALG